MKSLKQLNEERGQKLDSLQSIVDLATTEKRELNDKEKETRNSLNAELDALDVEIAAAEKTEKRLAAAAGAYINKQNKDRELKETSEFRFNKFIREAASGNLTGFEKEMAEEGLNEARAAGVKVEGQYQLPSFISSVEKRALSATGGSSGSEGGVMVQTDQMGFIDALLSKLILTEAGATTMTGLMGNVDIPKISTSATTAWEGEVDQNADSSQAFSKLALSPKRLGAYSYISKQLINQSSYSAEQVSRNDIERAIMVAVQNAAIYGPGSGGAPTGITLTSGIGSVAGGTNGLAPTWAHVLGLEKEVAIDNADFGSLHYLTNPQVRAKLKATAVGTDQRMVWDQSNTLNGYSALTTSSVPSNLTKGTSSGVCSAIIFGNFADLVVANWAGLDITVDPYTRADYAQIRLIINSWWDIGIRNPQSFAAMLDALTT